jgi:hypothetical protein
MKSPAAIFAEKYAGKQIRLKKASITGRVVGYSDYAQSIIVVELNDNSGWRYPHHSFVRVVECDINKTFRFILINDLELVEEIKPAKVYPNTCKNCKLPARKIGALVFCSNVKCKSRKKVNKLYKSASIIFGDSPTDPIIVKCPVCKNICEGLAHNMGKIGSAVMCPEHNWQPFKFELQKWYHYSKYNSTSQYVTKEEGYWKIWKK